MQITCQRCHHPSSTTHLYTTDTAARLDLCTVCTAILRDLGHTLTLRVR